MEWTVNYYIYHSKVWIERRTVAENHGHQGAASYASRKIAVYLESASTMDARFKRFNRNYRQLVK
jgi:hypothetical protein